MSPSDCYSCLLQAAISLHAFQTLPTNFEHIISNLSINNKLLIKLSLTQPEVAPQDSKRTVFDQFL